ncbi:MAG: hypothetical protein PF590_02640 [Candidatus Delongbacteria bacterium]|nr:hypothetical protein [Candidatus Delongbacteria bacterium]
MKDFIFLLAIINRILCLILKMHYMKNLLVSVIILIVSYSAFSQYVVVLHGTDTTAAFTGSTSLSDDFYLSVPSTTFDFADGYHPDPVAIPSFLGTDGEQIGVYGGLFPLKEAFMPQNPHVISKIIEHNTNESGNLPVEFDVSAQDE